MPQLRGGRINLLSVWITYENLISPTDSRSNAPVESDSFVECPSIIPTGASASRRPAAEAEFFTLGLWSRRH